MGFRERSGNKCFFGCEEEGLPYGTEGIKVFF